MKSIEGGITAPKGFRAGAALCGIKYQGRKDLAVIVSDVSASCAGVFTMNRIKAAPVLVSRERVRYGIARAIIANSGNANACTGEDGIAAAIAMAGETAKLIGCDPLEVLVASTGVIGRLFPIEKALSGLPQAFAQLSYTGGTEAALAIMTTDKVVKETAVEFDIDGTPVRIGAVAKGAGMICPDMATLLCFITTDADIKPSTLRKALRTAVQSSFNSITVDGDMSTNDTVLVLANGLAQNQKIRSISKSFEIFTEVLSNVCRIMAKKIVYDGEGATKFIAIHVKNAAGKEDARRVGLAVANSLLVKTAFFGEDPNWGRIISAAGYSGVPVQESLMTIAINGITVFEKGVMRLYDEKALHKQMALREIYIDIDLNMGKTETTLYTTDISYDYIKINAEYTT